MVKLIFLIIGAATGVAEGNSPERLLVDAQAAIVEIDPIASDHQLITLPKLHFSLELQPVCGATARIQSISISAADTQQTYGADDIGSQSIVTTTLSIPRKQLGAIRIGDFCHTTAASAVLGKEMFIRGALTAHISLRCASDDEHSMTYVSQGLDIILRCKSVDDAAPNVASENQESSAAADPRL